MAQDPSEPPAEQGGLPGSGDPATLWGDFAPPLRAFLARRVPAGVEPDDLLQDVFLRVVKHLDSLRSRSGLRPGSFRLRVMHSGTPCVHANVKTAGRIRWTSMCRQWRTRPSCANPRRSSRRV